MKKVITAFVVLAMMTGCSVVAESDAVHCSSGYKHEMWDVTIKTYVDALAYELGNTSWQAGSDISADALVIHYFYMAGVNLVSIPENLLKDDAFGNPLIPAELLESALNGCFDFDIPSEYLRESRFYSETDNAYWSGGIGTTVQITVMEVYQNDIEVLVEYKGIIHIPYGYEEVWVGELQLIESGSGAYRYVFHNKGMVERMDGNSIEEALIG